MNNKNKELNNMENDSLKNTGCGFCGLLFAIMFILKLAKAITWSWWIVTAPIWILLLLGLIGWLYTAIFLE